MKQASEPDMQHDRNQDTHLLEDAHARILELTSELAPQHVLVLSDQLAELLALGQAACRVSLFSKHDLEPETFAARLKQHIHDVDMVLVSEYLEQQDSAQSTRILGQIRNLLNAKIAVILPKDSPLQFSDMIGLGFKRDTACETGEIIYTYDIASYNKKREWNNSRFWANPENFNKYRW